MTEITMANHYYTTPGAVFRLWADFWMEVEGRIPPLHHYKSTVNGALLFAVPLPVTALEPFLDWAGGHPDLRFQGEGSSWLDDRRWLGHWACFSAQVRAVHEMRPVPPKMPPPLPKTSKVPK
jgi:hypothetical protein